MIKCVNEKPLRKLGLMCTNLAGQKPGLLVVAERQKDCVNLDAVSCVELGFHERVNDGTGFVRAKSRDHRVFGAIYYLADHFQNSAIFADKQKGLVVVALAPDIVNIGSLFPP